MMAPSDLFQLIGLIAGKIQATSQPKNSVQGWGIRYDDG
jgi:hypothetical protein